MYITINVSLSSCLFFSSLKQNHWTSFFYTKYFVSLNFFKVFFIQPYLLSFVYLFLSALYKRSVVEATKIPKACRETQESQEVGSTPDII